MVWCSVMWCSIVQCSELELVTRLRSGPRTSLCPSCKEAWSLCQRITPFQLGHKEVLDPQRSRVTNYNSLHWTIEHHITLHHTIIYCSILHYPHTKQSYIQLHLTVLQYTTLTLRCLHTKQRYIQLHLHYTEIYNTPLTLNYTNITLTVHYTELGYNTLH